MSQGPHRSETGAVFSLIGADLPGDVSPLCLEVTIVEEPRSKDEKISRAVNSLIPIALERRQGILVIRRDYGKYTVRVDGDVPCGMIHESRE